MRLQIIARVGFGVLLTQLLISLGPLHVNARDLKFATVVPDNGPGASDMRQVLTKVRDESDGELSIKIYGGGIAGDEFDILRKMRTNRIDAAAFSGMAIRKILPRMCILELPGLYRNYAEADYVRQKMFDTFYRDLAKEGFTMLGVGDIGFSYFFSNQPMGSPLEIKNLKMWTWQGDKAMKAFMEIWGMTTVPLHVMDVNMGLQTGMADSFIAPPMIATGLQWYSNARYMLDYPINDAMGAILMNKSAYDSLSEKTRKLMKEYMGQYYDQGVQMIRKLNEESRQVLINSGIQFIKPLPEHIQVYENYFKISHQRAIDEGVIPKELYQHVNKLIEECRMKAALK